MGTFIGNIALKSSDTKKICKELNANLVNLKIDDFYITAPVQNFEYTAIFPDEISTSKQIAETFSKIFNTIAISGEIYDSDEFELHIFSEGNECFSFSYSDMHLEYTKDFSEISKLFNYPSINDNFYKLIGNEKEAGTNIDCNTIYRTILDLLNLKGLYFLQDTSYTYIKADLNSGVLEEQIELGAFPQVIDINGKSTNFEVKEITYNDEKKDIRWDNTTSEKYYLEHKTLCKNLNDKINAEIPFEILDTYTLFTKNYIKQDASTFIFYSKDDLLLNTEFLKKQLDANFQKVEFYNQNEENFSVDVEGVTFRFFKILDNNGEIIILINCYKLHEWDRITLKEFIGTSKKLATLLKVEEIYFYHSAFTD